MMALSAAFLAFGIVPVVFLLLEEVLLNLLDVFVALRRRREYSGYLERYELGDRRILSLGLERPENLKIFDGVVDRCGRQECIEKTATARGIVLVENSLGDRTLGERLTGLGNVDVFRFVVVDMEAEDVPVLNRVGDRVGMEFILEQVFCSSKRSRFPLDLPDGRIVFEDRGAGEAE